MIKFLCFPDTQCEKKVKRNPAIMLNFLIINVIFLSSSINDPLWILTSNKKLYLRLLCNKTNYFNYSLQKNVDKNVKI